MITKLDLNCFHSLQENIGKKRNCSVVNVHYISRIIGYTAAKGDGRSVHKPASTCIALALPWGVYLSRGRRSPAWVISSVQYSQKPISGDDEGTYSTIRGNRRMGLQSQTITKSVQTHTIHFNNAIFALDKTVHEALSVSKYCINCYLILN